MLYFVIILISMCLIETLTVIMSAVFNLIPLHTALLGPIITNFTVLGVMGLVSLVLRLFCPPKKCKHTQKCFNIKPTEIKLYNKLKIKKWKDKVPEMGCAGGFKKDKIKSLEPTYLFRFIKETCFAEVLHAMSAVLAFAILFFAKPHHFVFIVPVLIVNFVLHILPCIIQRYNRFRISKIYLCKCKVN